MNRLQAIDPTMLRVDSVAKARDVQQLLRTRVVTFWDGRPVQTVAGVDVGIQGSRATAAVVVLSYPDLRLIERTTCEEETAFPYVPGYLGFREAPVVVQALSQLRAAPDLVLVDGQGLAHPRRMGVASHLGVLLDVPTVGCAKSRLFGEHGAVPLDRGDWSPLLDPESRNTVGAVVRTRVGVKPVYVSVGHRIDLDKSIEIVVACARTRLPEPLRLAHTLASHGDAALDAALARRRPR